VRFFKIRENVMRVNEHCAECLWDKQQNKSKDADYLREVKSIIENRKEEETAPYLVYLFNKAYERRFGKNPSYEDVKKEYNDFVLSLEKEIRSKIEESADPLAVSLAFARAGNYIDFGAMNHVSGETLMELLNSAGLSEKDLLTLEALKNQCKNAKSFLLIADNCGEIVLDKLFLEQLKKLFPELKLTVMVRGAEVLNDATMADAKYAGLDNVAEIVSSGSSVAGVIYTMLPDAAKKVFDEADVILSKGQGNYESLCGQGWHIFYSLLCKCDLFTERFGVERLTGIFVESAE